MLTLICFAWGLLVPVIVPLDCREAIGFPQFFSGEVFRLLVRAFGSLHVADEPVFTRRRVRAQAGPR
jgi:hypothetical protein